MKKYCSNCKYYYWQIMRCVAPQNLIKIDYFWGDTNEYKEHPAFINLNNNCPYYKRKWWKFWIKANK